MLPIKITISRVKYQGFRNAAELSFQPNSTNRYDMTTKLLFTVTFILTFEV